jgi:Na+/H+ antiporter NhaD/arsenite permease-like protein
VHILVFFIILVGNIGGALSPLGDPPLFIGFLKGVDFFWTTRVLALPTLALVGALLAIFYVLDRYFWRSEDATPPAVYTPLGIDGAFNFALIAGVVGMVLLSGIWKPGIAFDIAGTPLELQNLVRDVALAPVAVVVALTPQRCAKPTPSTGNRCGSRQLFAGIFLTIIPVIAMLHAGARVRSRASSTCHRRRDRSTARYVFLDDRTAVRIFDNAPTYLVFLPRRRRPAALMYSLQVTLAMFCRAVYFGALTYVGNAPNFMIKAIAESRGVKMPSFFGYLGYTSLVLLPLFAIITWIYS